jgi:hypothetical protein
MKAVSAPAINNLLSYIRYKIPDNNVINDTNNDHRRKAYSLTSELKAFKALTLSNPSFDIVPVTRAFFASIIIRPVRAIKAVEQTST